MLDVWTKKNTSPIPDIGGGQSRYSVTRAGIVYDHLLGENVNEIDGLFTLHSFDDLHSVKLPLRTVILLAFKPLYKSYSYIESWDVEFLDDDERSVAVSNMIWKPPYGGSFCPEIEGYRVIPITGRYAISECGQLVYDRMENQQVQVTKNNVGYLKFALQLPDLTNENLSLHVAQKLAHGDYDVNFVLEKQIVNHEDGQKDNNVNSNLTFTDYSTNNKHAVRMGLRDVATSVDVLDLETNNTFTFETLCELSEFLELNSGIVWRHLKNKVLLPIRGKYVLKYSDSPYEFPEYKQTYIQECLSHLDKSSDRKGTYDQECMACDIRTGVTVIADNPMDLAKLLGFTWDDIKTALRIGGNTRGENLRLWPYRSYEFYWLDQYRRSRKYAEDEIKAFTGKSVINNPVRVHLPNGTTEVYCSLAEACKIYIKPSRPIIRKALAEGLVSGEPNKVVDFGDFKISYVRY